MGIGIGYQGEATGEVCFNTSLTGYQEIISDPSYAGQIINFTFPHIGNVGTNKEDHESDKIWARGVIFNSEITSPSNYRSFLHLDSWLKKNKNINKKMKIYKKERRGDSSTVRGMWRWEQPRVQGLRMNRYHKSRNVYHMVVH